MRDAGTLPGEQGQAVRKPCWWEDCLKHRSFPLHLAPRQDEQFDTSSHQWLLIGSTKWQLLSAREVVLSHHKVIKEQRPWFIPTKKGRQQGERANCGTELELEQTRGRKRTFSSPNPVSFRRPHLQQSLIPRLFGHLHQPLSHWGPPQS